MEAIHVQLANEAGKLSFTYVSALEDIVNVFLFMMDFFKGEMGYLRCCASKDCRAEFADVWDNNTVLFAISDLIPLRARGYEEERKRT